MHRRLAPTLLASALLSAALGVGTATAAGEVTMSSPRDGDVVRDRVTLFVDVARDDVSEVSIRLSKDEVSGASNTTSIPLPCVRDCDGEATTSTWGDRTFDPVSGAPFTGSGICNGNWFVQARLDKESWQTAATVTISAPAEAPGNVKVTEQENSALVTWSPSEAPDLVGYRIERAARSGGWVTIDQVDPFATSVEDTTISRGEFTYRVVALRPDGYVGGRPVAPCADEDADLETASAGTVVHYQSSPNGSTDDGTTSDGSSTGTSDGGQTSNDGSSTGTSDGGSGSTGSSTGETSGGTDTGSTGTADDGSTSGTSSSSSSDTSSGSSRQRRVAAPPSANRQTDTTVEAPTLPESQERYYGEDDQAVGELDYGDTTIIAGEQVEVVGFDENGEPIYQVVAGGTETQVITALDASKLRAIAGGLLLVALAMHARRWINAH